MSKRSVAMVAVVSAVVLALLITVIVLASKDCDDCDTGRDTAQASAIIQHGNCYQGSWELPPWNARDGVDVKMYPNLQSLTDLEQALKSGYQVIEIIPDANTGTSLVTMTTSVGNFKLTDVMTQLRESKKFVTLKVNLHDDVTTQKTIKEIKEASFHGVLMITIPIMQQKPGYLSWSRTSEYLTDMVEETNVQVIVNFDLFHECCDGPIENGVFEYIAELTSNRNFSYTIEIEASSIENTWESLRYQLEKNNGLKLIISDRLNTDRPNVAYKLLRVRNDIDGDKVFYNIRGTIYNTFRDLASVGGSPLLYFDIHPRDAGSIIWSHNTDTWPLLKTAVAGDVMMIEGDIMVLGQNTRNQTNIPIMAHDLGENNNLTFSQWLDEIIKVNKGMKFDFKYLDAVKPALDIVLARRSAIKGPIWINADILKGPNAKDPRINKTEFLETAAMLPGATLSLGWTTVQKGDKSNLKLTKDMVSEMYELCIPLSNPITFPVRAEQFRDSWDSLDWLLRKSRDYTLTVWTGHGDRVTKADMDFMKRKAEMSRIYFDLPLELRPRFGY